METLAPARPDIRDSFIDVAERICAKEYRSLTEHGRMMASWSSADSGNAYAQPISLYQVIFQARPDDQTFKVAQATFRVEGDLETFMTVSNRMPADLDGDPLAADVLEVFQTSFDTHPHGLCIRAVREQLQAQRHRERLFGRLAAARS